MLKLGLSLGLINVKISPKDVTLKGNLLKYISFLVFCYFLLSVQNILIYLVYPGCLWAMMPLCGGQRTTCRSPPFGPGDQLGPLDLTRTFTC